MMPNTIDLPHSPGRRRRVLLVVVPFAVLFLFGNTVLSSYVNSLWFSSLGYGEVFWKTLGMQWGVFAAVAMATFLLFYGTFFGLKRIHRYDLPGSHTIILNRQPVTIPLGPLVRWLAVGVSGVIALVSGLAISADWPVLACFWYAPQVAGGTLDPILGKPLNFYLFTLPVWRLTADWLTTLAVFALGIAVFFLFIANASRALEGRREHYIKPPWRGLSLASAFLLLMLAVRMYIGRFDRMLGEHTVFSGATYMDAHLMLKGLLIVCIALLLGAAVATASAFADRGWRWLGLAVLPAVISFVALQLFGWYVNSFIVKPNELVRERPYIGYNIEFTRKAYGLDRIAQREFSAQTTVESADAANNQDTLTYYDFPDIDIDRYDLNGTTRQVMISTRELNTEKLPESSRNWINEKLIYTHGYGVTMNSVNGFTAEGLPTLMLGNMPVQSTVPGLTLTRPEVYFGELTDKDVYVKTGQKEFNYPQGQSNNLTSYEGSGGILLGGFLRRVIIALDQSDLAKLPFSDDVNKDSRLLMRRNIRERVAALAPFLTYDPDAYIVLGDDGRLSWIMDAFTVSDSYPYSTHYRLDNSLINYMRNSVKVVIDAYDGTTTFYVFDTEDPIISAYRRIFPSLFKDAVMMPPGLRKH